MERVSFEQLTELQQEFLREFELYHIFHALPNTFHIERAVAYKMMCSGLQVQSMEFHRRPIPYTKHQRIIYAYFKGLRIDRAMPFARSGQPKVTSFYKDITKHMHDLAPVDPRSQNIGGLQVDMFLQNFSIFGLPCGKWND